MSGARCPDCGEAWFEPDPTGEDGEPSRCSICGWRGDLGALGRKILPGADRDGASLRQRKDAGQLFFVRVRFSDDLDDDATFAVMEALGVDHAQPRPRLVLVEMDREPTDAQLAAVRKVPRVRDVEVV